MSEISFTLVVQKKQVNKTSIGMAKIAQKMKKSLLLVELIS